jgi:hypothetical protein
MKLKHLLGTEGFQTFVFVEDASNTLLSTCPVYKTISSHKDTVIFFNVHNGNQNIFEREDVILDKEIKLLVI